MKKYKSKYYKCRGCGKSIVDKGEISSVYYLGHHKYCNKCFAKKIKNPE